MALRRAIQTLLQSFGRQSLRRYANNLGWLIAEKGLRFSVGIWLAPWVASYLMPARYGVYEFAVSFVYLFSALTFVGVNTLVVREYVVGKYPNVAVLGSGLALRFLGGLGAYLLLLTCGYWGWKMQPDWFVALPANEEEFWLIAVLGTNLMLNIYDIFTSFYQAQVQSQKYVKVQFVVILLSSALKLYGLFTEQGLLFFVSILVVEDVVTLIGLAVIYQWAEKNLARWRVRTDLFGLYFRESIPLIISSIAITLYMRIDQVMVKQLLGNEASGYYAAAVRLSEMWYVVPTLLASTLFPAIVAAKKESEQKFEKRLQQLMDLLAWASVGFALSMQLLAHWLIVDVLPYGEAYTASAAILQVHVWAGLFVALGLIGSRWMIVEKIQRYAMWQNLLGASLNIALNLFFIPTYGLIGVAWATLLSYFVSAMGLAFMLKRLRPLLRLYLQTLTAPIRLLRLYKSK
jgi:O-antigen/teichoic acid export membrane protein